MSVNTQKPTAAFIGASWLALVIGMSAYLIGLMNAKMEMIEKGYYFTLLLFGLFSVIAVQKSVRDRIEGVGVTNLFYGISWFCVVVSLSLLTIGLWNSTMLLSEKGFYGVSMAMALFAVSAVQKNVRDLALFTNNEPVEHAKPVPPTPNEPWIPPIKRENQ